MLESEREISNAFADNVIRSALPCHLAKHYACLFFDIFKAHQYQSHLSHKKAIPGECGIFNQRASEATLCSLKGNKTNSNPEKLIKTFSAIFYEFFHPIS